MSVTMRQMLEAGVHFGHQTRFWNPKMARYIFGHRNKIHIINLEKTLPLYHDAMKFVRQLASNRGTILFVGTKRQAREIVAEEAQRAGMPYVDHRWLGGMLTNFKTVKAVDQAPEGPRGDEATTARSSGCRKNEALSLQRELDKLEKSLGGIKDMTALPDAMFVIDVGYHKIAVTEAKKLGIPVVGVVDTNHSPDRHRLRDPGQRRLEPRDPPVRARRRRRGARRQEHDDPGDRRSPATSSSKSTTKRRPDSVLEGGGATAEVNPGPAAGCAARDARGRDCRRSRSNRWTVEQRTWRKSPQAW